MNWLMWKQHRKSLLVLITVMAIYAVVVVTTGAHFWSLYQHALKNCRAAGACNDIDTQMVQSALFSNVNPSQPSGGFNIVVLLLLTLPFTLEMFIGVPLISREYEARTNLLIWTRSVSRRRWLTIKLAWVLIATLVAAGAFAALTTWWARTGNALYDNRFDGMKFGLQGLAPVAYALFAVSLGIALGTWLKRIMPAIGIMLVVMLAVQIGVVSWVRPHYMTPKIYEVSLAASGYSLSPPTPSGSGSAWILEGDMVNKTGAVMNWSRPPKGCAAADAPAQTPAAGPHVPVDASGIIINGIDMKCLETLGYHWRTTYQPADRYWTFQFIELALYTLLSLIPLGATYWLVLKRDA